ncbi:MAG: hypothetical protein RL145_2299 [Pseudomonadota bacterium]|jgi:hypothetical protein
MRHNLTPADVVLLNYEMGKRLQQLLPKITGGVCAGLTAQLSDIFAVQEANERQAAAFKQAMLAAGQSAPPVAPDLSLELMHGLTATSLSSLVVSVLAHLECTHLLAAIVQQLADPEGSELVLCSFTGHSTVVTPIMGHVDAPFTQKATEGHLQ